MNATKLGDIICIHRSLRAPKGGTSLSGDGYVFLYAKNAWRDSVRGGLRRSVAFGVSVAALSVGAMAINTVTPQPALAFTCLSTQNPAGNNAGATDNGNSENTACGKNANAGTATNGKATAYGDNAKANASESVAVGESANVNANAQYGIAIGRNATVDGTTTTTTAIGGIAVGRNAHSYNDYAVSIGESSSASGNRSVALGKSANAQGDQSIAIGNSTLASGTNDTVGGVGSQALSDNGAIWGANATIKANSSNSSAFGANTAIGANSANSMALGANTAVGPNAPGAVAIGTDSTGHGAVATLPNQIVAGTANQTITAPGITSSLSRSRQSGPLEVVTSDANGNLATDGGDIFRRLDKNQEGVALALAAVNPDLTGNERFGMTANWGNFDSANAFGMGFEGVLGHDWITRGDRIAVTGGWGVGFAQGNGDDVFGGRVGGQWTW
jgi:hypothetical protein